MRGIAIAVPIVCLAAFASPCSANIIGLFGDEHANVHELVAETPFETVNLYVVAVLTDIAAMTAAEFGSDPLEYPDHAVATPHWSSDLIIGDLLADGGMSITWSAPVPGPIVNIGHISYLVIEPLPCTESLSIIPHPDSGLLVIVDELFMEYAAMAWGIGVNCDAWEGWYDCICTVATERASLSDIKALY